MSTATLGAVTTTRLVLPRGAGTLEFHRDRATGALLGIEGGGTTYLRVEPDGTRTWPGVCRVREERTPDGTARHVETAAASWTEHYRWQADRLVEVDGVEVRRDADGRVIACLPGGADPAPASHRWLYAHHGPGPIHITTPAGARQIATTPDGVVRSWREGGRTHRCAWAGSGARLPLPRPTADHVDEAGRHWATLDARGHVRHLYLWDGTRCLARVDGPVGAPLAAVFSLDPSATPVRIVTPQGVTRVPRDAYGEGLLAHPGVPGLFGGHVRDGVVHLPLRRLDPRTGTWCEPDPLDGGDGDPRRAGGFPGELPVEPDPRSRYEVCRGDPIGRADPTGGVSAGLVISTLTWSFQNNILTFFGIDWWFNLFASLVSWSPFFGSDGLAASSHRGGFGVRRDGVINRITGGRAFTTQHIVWAPDEEFAELQRGEVIDAGTFAPTHYGAILAAAPAGRPRTLLASMSLAGRDWVRPGSLPAWTRHGGVGAPVAPGTLTPWFPSGGLHLDTALDTRHDVACTVTELVPGAGAVGTLEPRTFLTARAATGLGAGDRVVVDDGTTLALAGVVGTVPVAGAERVQLDGDLPALGTSGLTLTQVTAAPASSEQRPAGAPADSLDARGTTATYAANDLLRLTDGGGVVTVARVSGLQAAVPLERPLPVDVPAPVEVALGVAGAGTPVTLAGANLDFGTATRPAVGTVGAVTGGGATTGVRIVGHDGASAAVLDAPLPAAIAGAATIAFHPVSAGPVLGRAAGPFGADARLTYVPEVAGAAPDGAAGTVLLRCSGGGQTHVRVVPGAPAHDVVVLDRALGGASPWTVERFPLAPGARPVTELTRADVVGLVVPDPAPFAAAPAVFLTRVTGDPPTAATTLLAGVDVAAGVVRTTRPTPTPSPDLEPGRPVLVGGRVASVRTIRVTVTLDRPYDLTGSGLRAVGLTGTGWVYACDVLAPAEVLARPRTRIGGADVDVPFPRFRVGDVVRVQEAGGPVTWHRVESAIGGRLRLADGPVLTAGATATIQHAATTDPRTGGPFLAIDGTRSGSGPTAQVTFAVWRPDALAGGPIGIVDGDVTHPATVVAGGQPLEVTFGEAFDAAGVDVASLDRQADAFVTTLARDGGVLLVEGATATALGTPAGQSLAAVAYGPGAVPAAAGTVGPGTLLVPESERTEIDRGQALVDHELEHTLQYAKWGPLWFNAFPMLALELPGILATDTELPDYSRFLDASVAAGTGSDWALTIPATAGVSIAAQDTLQVVQGSRRAQVRVRSVSGSVYTVRAEGAAPPTGQVSVRKHQNATRFDVVHAILDLLTHGGLVNVLAGSTWGGIFWLIGKGAYGLGRAIAGTGDLHPATVGAGGGSLTLADDAGRGAIRESGRVVVRQGDTTVVRTMTRSGDAVTLTEAVTFTGGVQVAMYDTHDPGSHFDWYDYRPATIDADNPARLTVDGGSFAADDRVQVKYRAREFKADVTAVAGSVVELLEPITVVDGERSARIAKVGSHDPLGNADSAAMVEMGMGWMKWVFDPYGQIEYAAAPRKEWARWLLRVMRWVLGTQNFSLLPFGYVWWKRLFGIQPEHLAPIEQEASSQSGDLYSPLGRLTGECRADGFARARMVVGDVARYRYWPLDRTRSFVDDGGLDAPGLLLDRDGAGAAVSTLRVLPNRAGTGPAGDPNGTTVVGPTAEPGRSVFDGFSRRDPDPRLVPASGGGAAADPLGFLPAPVASIPASARSQKTLGTYVAFTRPGEHRVTTVNGIFGGAEARDTHREQMQPLYFDVTAEDVAVTVAGQAVAEGGTVVLVPFQRAAVEVTPNGSRTYRLTVDDPGSSAVLRTEGLRLVGVGAGAAEPVEVSRFHAAAGGSYAPGGLAFAGMHLSREVDIPVRRFTAQVVDSLELRSAAEPTAATVPSLAIGAEAFLLVPAPIARAPRVTSVDGSAPPAGAANPVSRVASPGAATAAFLGVSGAAFRVSFPAASAPGAYVLTVDVGTGTSSVPLTCAFTLAP
jgi:hypothetical protein